MNKLLEINNISFNTGVDGIRRVSGNLAGGGILNICGPSGSGKTTLLRILAKLRKAEGGEVFLRGDPWTAFSATTWRRKVHYLSQKPAIFDGTVQDNLFKPFELAVIKQNLEADLTKANELMERMLLPQGLLNQDARTLSGGEKARMALIRAVLTEPEILLLDEPLAALDSKAVLAVLQVVSDWREETTGRGVILVSHVGEFNALPGFTKLELSGNEGDHF